MLSAIAPLTLFLQKKRMMPCRHHSQAGVNKNVQTIKIPTGNLSARRHLVS
nr:MAG TPA: hypothetical protein [Caudoviricetes sp.]